MQPPSVATDTSHQRVQSSLPGLGFSTASCHALTNIILQRLTTFDHRHTDATHGNLLISYVNPHVYNVSQSEPIVQQCLQHSDYLCVDGIGIKLALILLRGQFVPRVVAEHLFNHLVEKLSMPANAVLIGTSETEVTDAAHALQQFQPHLNIVGTLDGFCGEEQYTAFLKKHQHIPLILIGAGSPKSEAIALQAMQCCTASIIFHIGAGTIKTWAGSKRRGPAWMSAMGLQWLHRIMLEPHTRERYTKGAWLFAKNLMTSRMDHAGS